MQNHENTISCLNPADCCGCGACRNICPKGAIKMEYDGEGFLSPRIDDALCIDCGLCKKACPAMNASYANDKDPECFAIWADDAVRMKSSSGGMFTLVADYIFSLGGVVCGAAYDENFFVEHICITDPADLDKLRGSKYVQSNTKQCYREIKQYLDADRYVLFTGCPCQVAGLYGYLGKDYEKLYTLDLICHGTPSPLAFQKYIDDLHDREKIQTISFRDKAAFGWSTEMNIFYKDGSKYLDTCGHDPYYRMFLPCLAMRRSCSTCKYTTLPRQADISIGDFWGISKHDPEFDDHKGTSLVLVNNDRGRYLMRKIDGNVKKKGRFLISQARPRNWTIDRPFKPHYNRAQFMDMIKYARFDKALNYSVRRHFDVAIIGLWYGRNYGSMATYFALHQTIKSMGLSVLMIENALKPAGEIEMTKTHPRRIADAFYDVSKQYALGDMKVLNNCCDTFVVGSDQLWNVGLSRPYGQTYYLGFVGEANKKIAYGTSFGKEYHGTERERVISGNLLRRFDAVSVRDTVSVNECRDKFGVDAAQVCDPTLLCPMDEYEKLISRANLTKTEDYILAYILDPNAAIGRELVQLSQRSGKKVRVIFDEVPWIWQDNLRKLELSGEGDVEPMREVDLFEWMWYYKHADAVVTDSFHGTIFSLVFHKPFLTLVNVKRGAQRFTSLLEPLGLADRLLARPEDFGAQFEKLTACDYTAADNTLADIRSFSMDWLRTALFAPKKQSDFRAYSMTDERNTSYIQV